MRRSAVFAVLVTLFCGLAARAQRPAYRPAQLALVRSVTECRLSPDGRIVAFVSDITGHLELWTVAASGGWPHQLTSRDERIEDVHWSPDGQWLVFTSDHGGNERYQLYRVPAAGGAVERVTDRGPSESEPRFSPDGKRLAFLADPDAPFDTQLHVLDLATRRVTRLTREPNKVQTPVWSPDGKTLAVNRSGDDQKGDLLLLDAETGAKQVVAPSVPDGNLVPAAFAPNGSALLLLARNPPGFDQLAVLGLEAGKPRPGCRPRFLGPGDGDVTEACWTPSGVYFIHNQGGAFALRWLQGPDDRTGKTLLPARATIHELSFDRSGARLALLREDVTHPTDVWVGEAVDPARSRQVTFSLLGGVRPEELSQGAMIAYPSFDRTRIHALVMKPRVPRLGSPPPAVVYVHGGPDGQVTLEFNPYWHVLTEAGFVVIAPNYRGSTGYGKAFEDLNNKDWGGGDLKDLVAAVKFLASRGDIDPKRVGITGGSYGGYLTLMALCRTPDVWKAGVEAYGMPDLVMDYLLTKSRSGDWYETEMGNPKTHAALYRERSPLLYLDAIRAPLLVFQGANDTDVPKAESDLLVAVLRQLRKPHEYVVYEDEGHVFTRRRNRLDFYRRSCAFFTSRLRR